MAAAPRIFLGLLSMIFPVTGFSSEEEAGKAFTLLKDGKDELEVVLWRLIGSFCLEGKFVTKCRADFIERVTLCLFGSMFPYGFNMG